MREEKKREERETKKDLKEKERDRIKKLVFFYNFIATVSYNLWQFTVLGC